MVMRMSGKAAKRSAQLAVVTALSTLAFDYPPRAEFFRGTFGNLYQGQTYYSHSTIENGQRYADAHFSPGTEFAIALPRSKR